MSEIFSRSFGTGQRQVLAVHCSLAHSGAWRGLAQDMEPEITLTAFDMYSHGRSADWDQTAHFQTANVEAGLALLQQLTQPVDLVGHSFGATVALRMALARPELVQSLTLIEPVLFALTRQEAPDLQAALETEEAPFMDHFQKGEMEEATRFFNRKWGTGKPRWADMPEPARLAMIRAMKVIPECQDALYRDSFGLLEPGALDAVTMPVLLLSGGASEPVMPLINEGLVRRLPDARAFVAPGAGHMLPITHPKETAEYLRRFWAENDA